jgi:hypothetical protein
MRWEPWEEITDYNLPLGPLAEAAGGTKVYCNNIYTIIHRTLEDGCVWLSIRSNDNSARHDWRHFQKIKNDLVGPEIEAMEIYPKESRLADTSNQFHLWCLPPGKTIPFGFSDRLVTEAEIENTRQRPFETALKPSDLVSETDMRQRLKQRSYS